MKLYSFLGRLYFLILIYIPSTTWSFPYEKRSYSHVDTIFNKRKHIKEDTYVNNKLKLQFNIKDPARNVIFKPTDVHNVQLPQEVKYVTTGTHKYSGNVREYKNSDSEDVSLAEALTQESEENKSSFSMVLPIAGTLTVLFSMSILVAIFQCCCRKKRQTSQSEEVKTRNDKQVDSGKDSGDELLKDEEKIHTENKGSEKEEKEITSIKSKIKAFEGVIPTQPSPGPIRHVRKRPESNAFKALENQGIVYGMGKSPSRLSKTPEDENQNATVSEEVTRTERETTPDDDLGGYKQAENPDVVIADVDENDEFGVIVRDTSVLRSHKRAPPPKNRNRSSAAVRRKRARETNPDVLFNDSSNNSSLALPDDLELVYSDKVSVKSDTSDSKDRKKDKTDSSERNKNKTDSAEKSKQKKDKIKILNDKDLIEKKREETPTIVTSDHSDDNIIDISKQEVPPEVFSGGNIFMHIDPTVKKNAVKVEKKPATPPPTPRVRTSQLSVEERKEKAKSTPLLTSHEDLAKALGKLKSPSKENNSAKTAGKNRSSTDLSSNTKM
ncbi:MATH and LRR domain-containing protein PFE0570w-like [Mytilus trossulus]|uniref:MATH and LRR domain-containing protein PFE0570w-like n=1 Tax=Mytilus trossulus TaxID=6551 RepID=UPI003007E23E